MSTNQSSRYRRISQLITVSESVVFIEGGIEESVDSITVGGVDESVVAGKRNQSTLSVGDVNESVVSIGVSTDQSSPSRGCRGISRL